MVMCSSLPSRVDVLDRSPLSSGRSRSTNSPVSSHRIRSNPLAWPALLSALSTSNVAPARSIETFGRSLKNTPSSRGCGAIGSPLACAISCACRTSSPAFATLIDTTAPRNP